MIGHWHLEQVPGSNAGRSGSSPIGRGLGLLASEASLEPEGEGLGPLRKGRNPSPFRPRRLGRCAPCDAKAESPLPMGEEWVPLSSRREADGESG